MKIRDSKIALVIDKEKPPKMMWTCQAGPIRAAVRNSGLQLLKVNVRGRGRPEVTWGKMVRKGNSARGLTEDTVLEILKNCKMMLKL